MEYKPNPKPKIEAGMSQPFEKMVLSELGAKSLDEVHEAMENGTWPFKIEPKELWKKIADYFEQPLTMEDIVDLLLGNKTEEEVKKGIEKKRWPFNISEKEMREGSE